MALKLLQPGSSQPFGQFDGKDSDYLSIKGGEVVTLTTVTLASLDKATKDIFDGYQNPGTSRVAVTSNVVTASRPLFLADDGVAGYGTLFGTVVGGVAGQIVTGGTVLGPSTATGSGKITCWAQPGLFAVSLDACDTTSGTGLVANNTSLATGTALNYVSGTGLLTPAAGASTVVARFVDFETNGSLVTTPSSLVGTLNTPDGALSSTVNRTLAFAVFYWNPPVQ